MKIADILKSAGWTPFKRKGTYYGGNGYSALNHPTKNMYFTIQSKSLYVDGKLKAIFTTTRKQDECYFDDVNKLLVIGNEIAIHIG